MQGGLHKTALLPSKSRVRLTHTKPSGTHALQSPVLIGLIPTFEIQARWPEFPRSFTHEHCSAGQSGHLGLGAAPAIPGMEASVPPTRAAPINLSALPRVRLPLASPLVSSSKEWFEVCWLTCAPFPKGRDSGKPRPVEQRSLVCRLTRPGATSENASYANFAELCLCELRRIPIPRTRVNKGKNTGRGC
jgi:hypothetical protein